jgi:hypothetical protein
MRSLWMIMLTVTMLGACSHMPLVQRSSPPVTPALDQVDWLFLFSADQMTVDGDALVLSGLDDRVYAFTDRPHRIATPIPINVFIAGWHDGEGDFVGMPPNAGITLVTPVGPRSTIVELTHPQLSDDGLRFRFRRIGGAQPADGETVSVFIDSFPTAVNSQITDSVAQVNTQVVGDAPAVAMGNLYQATAQALSNSAHNATSAQQNANTVLQATTTQGVDMIYGADDEQIAD